MAYWLMKSEPDVYSWGDLVQQKIGFWDGVRNHSAKQNLNAMRVGDEALFYHSNIGRECVGIMKIVAEARPDHTVEPTELKKDGSNPWVGVKVAPVRKFTKPVTLAMVKATPALQNMALIKYQRLSVQPVTPAEWSRILKMAEEV